jgi:Fe-S-cluster-containing dehydrogenase component/anaerobic selenocysteine-containing dehydrogenase
MKHESRYWQSLRGLNNGVDEQKAKEFMDGVTDDFSMSEMSVMSRKKFLALLSASAAVAAAGCTGYHDRGQIVPYTRKPAEVTPGVSNFYASTCTGCAQSCGILVKTREGRPIKVDGNPDHPVNRGKSCAKGQGEILQLYDPARLRAPKGGAKGDATWASAEEDILGRLDAVSKSGREIAIISHAVHSPTTEKLLREFQAHFPGTKTYTYDLFHNDAQRRAWELAYGSGGPPSIRWEKAAVVVALESDFLGTEGNTVEQIARFSSARDIMKGDTFNRLYSVEGTMSLTGANADYRYRVRPEHQGALVAGLIHELGVNRGLFKVPASLEGLVAANSLESFARLSGLTLKNLDRLAADLEKNRGQSLVVAGAALPVDVHLLVNFLNDALGNDALYEEASVSHSSYTNASEWSALLDRMRQGGVGAVIHLKANPAYHLPGTLGYSEALKKVGLSISLTESENETSALCTYVLPVHHAFESWGDFHVRTGVVSFQQPLIAPLYDTRQAEAVLLSWMRGKGSYRENTYHQYLMARWEREVYPSLSVAAAFPDFWNSALHDGVVTLPNPPGRKNAFRVDSLKTVSLTTAAGFALVLTESHFVGDGRYANNGWMQELPHPVSKIVWDNYAAISKSSADELGVKDNDMISVSTGIGAVELPVFVQPGQADGLISVSLGYGRTLAGPIGTHVGVSLQPLLPAATVAGSRVVTGAVVAKGHGTYALASTQEHYPLDNTLLKDIHLRREIIREGTLEEYKKNPRFLHEKEGEGESSITSNVEYNGVKWAMAIDLNKCVGCNACVAGCNVENNIPVVGREQVAKGREMHWLRIDRYFAGSVEDPELSHQPMLCQHCDNAPCENVCPVVATTHSPDGLNQMTYNRCVGTKYCSNNCPYKVRRFNFFNWRSELADSYYEQESVSLMHNPEVTVRSRGVMEKCTFCVQRIMESRQHAAEAGTPFTGTDVRTACQEACPATAIVFGNANDPESEIARYRKHDTGYHVLGELNVKPNVTYVAKLRNIHPETKA